MKLENKKRAREGEEAVKESSKEKVAKKLDVRPSIASTKNCIDIQDRDQREDRNSKNNNINNNNNNDNRYELSGDAKEDKYLETGVFDIPWPKEGIMSQSPSSSSSEWCFPDTFSWSLHQEEDYNTITADHVCESRATCMASIDFPVDRFDDSAWSSILEMEDCTWISLFNHSQQQPLQREGAQ